MATPSTPAPRSAPNPDRRSERARQAILDAALELCGEQLYAGLTMEGIAKRAGVGKQTIYRWWPSKADVLLDALATKAQLHIPVPDEGGYEADLRRFLGDTFELGSRPQVVDLLRALMAEAQINEGFGERFREEFLRQRRDALGEILTRARARGDLPAGLPPETVTDIVFGTLWYRILATRRLPDRRLIEELVTALTGHTP
jgi:AcrR family transcriptional regulator